MSIYTKTGDTGTTSLYNKERYSKDSPVFDVLGNLDELNSCLGFMHIYKNIDIVTTIKDVQKDLFSLGSIIGGGNLIISWDERIKYLETKIDYYDSKLEELTNFILPGGSIFSSYLNLSRSVCRRLERSMVNYNVVDNKLIYINRLSDLLFVLGRYVNMIDEIPDTIWKI